MIYSHQLHYKHHAILPNRCYLELGLTFDTSV